MCLCIELTTTDNMGSSSLWQKGPTSHKKEIEYSESNNAPWHQKDENSFDLIHHHVNIMEVLNDAESGLFVCWSLIYSKNEQKRISFNKN